MNRERLLRAALIGAAIALVLGGAGTFYAGITRTFGAVDCGALSAEECAFEHETYHSIGRMQWISGAAMFALGLALYVLVRRTPDSQKVPDEAGSQRAP